MACVDKSRVLSAYRLLLLIIILSFFFFCLIIYCLSQNLTTTPFTLISDAARNRVFNKMQLSVTFPDSSFPDVVFTSTSCSLVKDAAEVAAAEWNVEADLLELSFAGQKLIKDSQLLSHGLGVGDQLEVSLMKLVSRRWLTDSTKMNSICLLYEKDDLISLDCQTFVVNNCLEFEGRLLPFKVENLSFCNPNRTMSIVGENFLSKSTIVKLSISALSSVVVIEEGFLEQCLTLTYIDLSGLHNVTSIGSNFLFGCKVLPAIDLSPLQSVTSIGSYFINSCDSLSELNLSGLNNVLSIGGYFLNNCPQVADLDLSCLCSLQYVGLCFLCNCGSLSISQKKDFYKSAVERRRRAENE